MKYPFSSVYDYRIMITDKYFVFDIVNHNCKNNEID